MVGHLWTVLDTVVCKGLITRTATQESKAGVSNWYSVCRIHLVRGCKGVAEAGTGLSFLEQGISQAHTG